MKFTDAQVSDIEALAGMNYSVRQIALYLDIPAHLLQDEFDNPHSLFRYHFDRGRLVAQALIDKANLESAQKGNITAIQRYDKQSLKIKTAQAKERIFGRS